MSDIEVAAHHIVHIGPAADWPSHSTIDSTARDRVETVIRIRQCRSALRGMHLSKNRFCKWPNRPGGVGAANAKIESIFPHSGIGHAAFVFAIPRLETHHPSDRMNVRTIQDRMDLNSVLLRGAFAEYASGFSNHEMRFGVWIAGETGEETSNSFVQRQIWRAGAFAGHRLTGELGKGWRRGSPEYAFACDADLRKLRQPAPRPASASIP